jgi:SAM-dependent MidA family methyltransferase
MNGSTLIIEEMWKNSQIHSNINVRFKIFTCVLIDYGKCKM